MADAKMPASNETEIVRQRLDKLDRLRKEEGVQSV